MFKWNMCCLKRVHSDQIQGCVTKAGFLQEALKEKKMQQAAGSKGEADSTFRERLPDVKLWWPIR